jgi:hypothetical protein
MGYRGLLLNDPYKRDRIDGCMLDMVRLHSVASNVFSLNRLNKPEVYFGKGPVKCEYSGFCGF